jgi:hypothetical protein
MGFEPSVPPWLGAFTPSKTSMSGSVGVGGFEKGEFEGNSATEKVAAQIGVRGPIRSNSARRGYPPSATVALTELGSDVPKSPAGNGSIGGSRDCATAAGQTTRTGNNAVRDNPTI